MISTEQRLETFKVELELIEDENIRAFTSKALSLLPDYFFTIAASTTGKYHPPHSLGEGGLVRHTQAAVHFLNQVKEFCNQNKNQILFPKKVTNFFDILLSGLILHDGWKTGTDPNQHFTVHEHPKICAEWIMSEDLRGIIDDELRGIISNLVLKHMGSFNTSKKSSVELPIPETEQEWFVHFCDYICSRKIINIVPTGDFDSRPEQNKKWNGPPGEYKLPFGKHKGQTVKEIQQVNPQYLDWLMNNTTDEKIADILKKFFEELRQF